ncbi:AMP-binding protein [Mesorhizobium sp. CAU 1741]|uniref:phenylacetate--CoA ligase family protein n=1 Tax=Mesorhizobium sp. CAU 1741 TaxID=3140366 RepID=UPI00325A98DD
MTAMRDDLFLDSAAALKAAREAVFSETLDRIFAYHPHYRQLFEQKGIGRRDIGGIDDLVRLPVTGKTDFVARPADFTLSLPAGFDAEERVVWDVMYTTGSTGDPTPFTSTSYDFINILALNRNMLRLRGVTDSDSILNLFPLTRHPHGAFARAMNAAAAFNIPIVAAMPGAPSARHPDLGSRMDAVCTLAGRSNATILWGVPSYIRKMLGRAEEMGVALPAVRLVFVTGEGFGEEARQDLVDRLKRLGAADPVISVSYGATEMQGGMVECRPGAGYHNPAPLQFLFEAVDPDSHAPVADGEEGLILLTHLDRRGTTMLRYALGDTARLTRDRCPHCGALTERLVSVPVRRDGFLKVRGMLINPQALADMLASEAGIADYQAIVDKQDEADALSMDRLRIRLLPRSDAGDDLAPRLADRVKSTIGVMPSIEIVAADDPAFADRGWKARPILDIRKKPE